MQVRIMFLRMRKVQKISMYRWKQIVELSDQADCLGGGHVSAGHESDNLG